MSDFTGEALPARQYRILSLDGGGIKGAYTLSVLHTLESLTGESVSQHFDLITGTSTGGIIAVAIGLGVPLTQMVELYESKGTTIFPRSNSGFVGKARALWQHSVRPKHSQAALEDVIYGVLGNRAFGESSNRLVIPAFNAANGSIQLFKTAHCNAYRMDYKLPAKTVALATSAAPTYYSTYTDPDGRSFLDGGVWANCPAMVGLIEATTALQWPVEQIEILSIGTTFTPFDVSHRRRTGGLLQWNSGLIDLFQEAQVRGTLGLVSAMIGHRMVRIDQAARPGRFSLDNALEVSDLKALGENSARQAVEEVSRRFFLTPTEPFIPCHSLDESSRTALVNRSLREQLPGQNGG